MSEVRVKAIGLQKVRYILAIAAGKGGVGKSTVAVNTALALKKMGYSVGVLDADLYGPSLPRMLPVEKKALELDERSYLKPFTSSGIAVMSLGYLRKDSEALAVRAPIANSVISQFLLQVDWGELDYLIIDLPPGTGDIHLTLLQSISLSGALIVTTPQNVALMDVRKAVIMLHEARAPVLGVIENMSHFVEPISGAIYYPFGSGGGERLSKEFGIPFFGEIPLDASISACADRGESIFNIASTPCLKAFENLCKQIVDELYDVECLEGDYLKEFSIDWSSYENE
jgi:ATP-binding protein involved in chromosome partitioning